MRLMITGRHVLITPALRQYIENKMRRFERYGVRLTSLQFLLSIEKFHHAAEALGVFHGRRLQAKASTQAMYASIDQVVDKLEKQIRKVKDRVISHKVRSNDKRIAPQIVPSPPLTLSTVDISRPPLREMTLEDALVELNSATSGVLVYQDARTGKVQVVQRHPNGRVSLIDPEAQRARASHART
jgi:putative sigma-54 modulation protein